MKIYKRQFKEAKELSVGTIITDNSSLLVGHVPLSKFWDIPKGHHEEGETLLQTAIRELKEETGLSFNSSLFQPIGKFLYTAGKDLFLYKIETDLSKIHLSSLKCTLTFERYGKIFPELDKYKIILIEEIPQYCAKNMARVLMEIF